MGARDVVNTTASWAHSTLDGHPEVITEELQFVSFFPLLANTKLASHLRSYTLCGLQDYKPFESTMVLQTMLPEDNVVFRFYVHIHQVSASNNLLHSARMLHIMPIPAGRGITTIRHMLVYAHRHMQSIKYKAESTVLTMPVLVIMLKFVRNLSRCTASVYCRTLSRCAGVHSSPWFSVANHLSSYQP